MINFYYDKVVNDNPMPNGGMASKFYDPSIKIYGYKFESGYPVSPVCKFYFAAKFHNAKPTVLTRDEWLPNTFYPIEIRTLGDLPIVEQIPKKSLRRLQKGKMSLLLFCLHDQGFQNMKILKKQVELFKENKVKNIIVVTTELTGAYKNYFEDVKLLSFDFSQTVAQIVIKNRKFKKLFLSPIERKMIDPLKVVCNPTKTYYSYCPYSTVHRLALVAELDYIDVDNNFNFVNGIKLDYYDPLIYNKFRHDAENILLKEKLLKYMDTGIYKEDNIQNYNDSLVNIYTQPLAGEGKELPEESHSIYTDYGLWCNILMEKPFIVLGSRMIMSYLNNEGYFTFPNIVNESYDRYTDIPLRVQAIGEQIEGIDDYFYERLEQHKTFLPHCKANKTKFLNTQHLSRFINLYDNIQYR